MNSATGPIGQCAFGLRKTVAAPIYAERGLSDRAAGLLILKRNAVGKSQQVDQFLAGQTAAVGQPDLYLKWISAIDGRRARNRGIEIGGYFFLKSQQNLLFSDRREAVGGRAHDLDAVDRLDTAVRLRSPTMVCGIGVRV